MKAVTCLFEIRPKEKNEITRLAIGFNSMIDRIEKLITKNYESQLMKQEAQISALQSQINPHFLYNTLAVIDGMALKNDQKEIAEVSELLGDIFRYSTSGLETATISDELAQTRKYLQIQQYRKKDNLEFEIIADESVGDNVVPKLLLQPIVENAIIHGLDMRRGLGRISVEVKAKEETIIIAINDNGMGMDEETLNTLVKSLEIEEDMQYYFGDRKIKSIGLSNVHNRIRNYFGPDYGMSLSSRKKYGTFVELRLPRIDNDNLGGSL